MEPLFENELMVDAGVLEEWQRKELATTYRPVYVLYFAMLALCLVFVAAQMGMAMAWVLAAVFALLFGVLAWTVVTLPRRLVRNALKKDTDNSLPYRSAVLVQPEGLTVLRNRPEDTPANEALTKVCLEAADNLQAELQQVMAQAQGLGAEDEDEMDRLRGKLVSMKQQMDALTTAMPRAEGEFRYDMATLDGYMRTEHLHGLYFDGVIVLLRRDGFIKGNDSDFTVFARQRLEQAAGATEDPKQKKALEKTLKRYWKEEEAT